MWTHKNNAVLRDDEHSSLRRFIGSLAEAANLLTVAGGTINPDALTRLLTLASESARALETAFLSIPLSYYRDCYGDQAVTERRFVNLGCGVHWSHPAWTGIDAASGHASTLAHDFSRRETLPIASGTAKVVYSSHLLEHLTDSEVRHVLAEARRILEPGGALRIVLPDAGLALAALRSGFRPFFTCVTDYAPEDRGESIEQLFLSSVAYPRSAFSPDTPHLRITDEECRRLAGEMTETRLFQFLCAPLERADVPSPGPHINWFTGERLSELLTEAGFHKITASQYGKSATTILRDTNFFDTTAPEVSLFVDAVKPGE
ncbi:MAG: methyltransferase domain-containing protein [Pseudomonadota bacterium]